VTKRCATCGRRTQRRSRFCSGCGSSVEKGASKRLRRWIAAALVLLIAVGAGAAGALSLRGNDDKDVTAKETEDVEATDEDATPPVVCAEAEGANSVRALRTAAKDCFGLSYATARCVVNELSTGTALDDPAWALATKDEAAMDAAERCEDEGEDRGRVASTPSSPPTSDASNEQFEVMDLLGVSRAEAGCILSKLDSMYGLVGREAVEYVESGSDALFGAWDACGTETSDPTYSSPVPAAPPTTARYVIDRVEYCDYSQGDGWAWIHVIEYFSDGTEEDRSRGVLCDRPASP